MGVSMVQRHHVAILTLVCLTVTIGVVLGSKAAVLAADFELLAAPEIATADPHHPVEVVFAAPFVRSHEEAVKDLGLTVYPEDRISSRPDLSLGIGGQLIIERAQVVMIQDGNEERSVRTWSTTVGELLAEQRIELGLEDRVTPALDTTFGSQSLVITRVSVTELKIKERIPFRDVTFDDPDRPRGERAVVQTGKTGTKELTYQVTRENGREVGRKLLGTAILEEPVEQRVAVGTRVKILASGKASWYKTPWGGLTAAHNSLPKGTIVDVVDVETGRRVTVTINDRGIGTDAIIDLSSEAFQKLAPLGKGIVRVRLEVPA